jgi:glycosyltransferase involved in cell wall biosynthesis
VLDARHGRLLRGRGIDRPVIAIPNGCDADEAMRPAAALPADDELRFVFLGRLDVQNKGLDLLLDAFKEAELGPARLTLQGRSVDGGSLGRLVAGRAEVRGFDAAHDGRSIISGYHVLCLPSRYEGFGMAALEAMLEGRVVLVSNVAGIAPHVEAADCGVVVPPTRAGIRDGLARLVARRDEWVAMGARGREYALEQLGWGRIGRDALAAYAVDRKDVDV